MKHHVDEVVDRGSEGFDQIGGDFLAVKLASDFRHSLIEGGIGADGGFLIHLFFAHGGGDDKHAVPDEDVLFDRSIFAFDGSRRLDVEVLGGDGTRDLDDHLGSLAFDGRARDGLEGEVRGDGHLVGRVFGLGVLGDGLGFFDGDFGGRGIATAGGEQEEARGEKEEVLGFHGCFPFLRDKRNPLVMLIIVLGRKRK